MAQVYLLTPQDTLPGMLAKLQAPPGTRVLFVVPSELTLTAAGMQALRRKAVESQVALALVTSDPAVRALADREGISTYRSQARAERSRWRRLRPEPRRRLRPATPAEIAAPPAPGLFARRSPTGFRPVAFLRAFVRRPSPWWAHLGLLLFLVALWGGLLYALSVVIPAATVTLVPSSQPVQITVPIQAIQGARTDAEAGIVTAQVLSVQVSGDARTQTTGRRFEPATKARGNVVLINRTPQDLLVPAGTVVSTATGDNAQFVTTQELILVPGGRAPVPVEAVLPGPSGNVRAGTITRVEGPLALSLLVTNSENFSGGTTAPVGVVTEEDKERLRAQLFEELKLQAQERLRERVGADAVVPPETINYLALSPSFTPFVGEVSPELYLRMSVQAVGLSVDRAAAEQVALARLRAAMPAGTRLIADSVRFTVGPAVVDAQSRVNFTVTAQGTLLRGVDVGEVRRAIVGLSPEEAAQVLLARFPVATSPQISLGPDWLPYIVPTNLPSLPWRIRVIVNWDVAARLAAVR